GWGERGLQWLREEDGGAGEGDSAPSDHARPTGTRRRTHTRCAVTTNGRAVSDITRRGERRDRRPLHLRACTCSAGARLHAPLARCRTARDGRVLPGEARARTSHTGRLSHGRRRAARGSEALHG